MLNIKAMFTPTHDLCRVRLDIVELISLSLFLGALDGLISEAGDAGNITTLLISPLWVAI